MADDGSKSTPTLPIAGLVGVAMAAVAVLAAHDSPFLSTRPAEPARAAYDSVATQRVDARLWQDPFSAVEDFERRELARRTFDREAARVESPDDASPAKKVASTPPLFTAQRYGVSVQEFRKLVAPSGVAAAKDPDPLVLPVLMAGSHFVGAEESRRRIRYAVVSALAELGYAPADSEHIGYVVAKPNASPPAAPPVRIPFEVFRFEPSRETASATEPDRLPPAQKTVVLMWVDDIALAAQDPGGSWFDSLAHLLSTVGACPTAGECRVPVIGPTSSDRFEALRDRAAQAADTVHLPWLVSPFVTSDVVEEPAVVAALRARNLTVIRTVALDRVVLKRIVDELADRGVDLCDATKRVLLVGEWDSQYGRRAMNALSDLLAAHSCPGHRANDRTTLLFYWFARGLDGVAVGSGETNGEPNTSAADKASQAPKALQIEWPEVPDQRDYLRRIGQQLTQLKQVKHIVAVDVMASDTHDKLLLMQELRGLIPRAPFFTTDVDAGYTHPLVFPWTRNLIIGTGYGLALRQDLQRHTAPFRDGYQASTFVATLVAVRLPSCGDHCGAWASLGSQTPQLFEVGRTRLVPLLPDTGSTVLRPRCTPEGIRDCASLQPSYPPPQRGFSYNVSLPLIFLLGALAAVGWAWKPSFLCLVQRRKVEPNAAAAAPVAPPHGRDLSFMNGVFGCGLLGSLLLAAYLIAQVIVPAWRAFPPEPLLWDEGISSWPIAFCWSLALCLTFVFLLRIASTVHARLEATAVRFLGPKNSVPAAEEDAPLGYLAWLCESFSVTTRPKPIGSTDRRDFAIPWNRYLRHGRGGRRALRIGILWVIICLAPFLMLHGDGLSPPAVIRGGFRFVIVGLDAAHYVMLTVLMAAVGDAVLLCTLFVIDVGRQRNCYPEAVLDATCERLGLSPALKPYLDEYIDTEIVADRTAAVADYLYYPFVVLAVLAGSMTNLFDDWVFSLARVGLYGTFTALLLLLWLGLHRSAINARDTALEEVEAIRLRLQAGDSAKPAVAKQMQRQFPLLMDRVRDTTTGAYGTMRAQPIFRALLWPLSGLSGAQLIQYFVTR